MDTQKVYNTIADALNHANQSLFTVYATYSNELCIIADSDDWDKIEFLSDVCRELERMIALNAMADAGWYFDKQETYPKWKKLN